MGTDAFDNLCLELSAVQQPEKTYETYPSGGITTPSENRVKYHLHLKTCDKAKIYAIDDGLLKNRPSCRQACDWLVLIKVTDSHGCFVELKRGSGEDAVLQLLDTLKQFDEKGWLQKINTRHACIVANSMPANAGRKQIEKARQEFARYNCHLRHVRNAQIDHIDI